VIDGKGNMSTMRIAELTNEFVRTWHLGGRAGHWEKGDAPALSAADLATLTADLARQPLTTSARARINLARQYPDARTPRAAYALRIIRSEEARTVRLLTGSDDGLRIWLNGRLVVSALKPRAARADAET